ncbi:hypothetical protein [Wenjunlia tyrosinilytica]|jgi:hypothetical protein|uniref:Uncharacterized protein n=1 Tax=Wenjunlia tyrosinilytica TaxID=1544741 RepID=A0A918DVG7_9ACTN|nr:hypothetical protein [Wenjunlia tyrosinilytica]GGO84210.1 hypothetical protein GCM10012280_15160 [Wenjunlia tyrosinilytica]
MTTRAKEIVLVGVGALCALTSAVLHLMLVPAHLEEMPYIGVLFLIGGAALILVALGLFRRNAAPAWVAGALLSAGMIVGFTLSRTVGLPGGYQEVGWEPPYGTVSVIAEVVLLFAFAAWLGLSPVEPAATTAPPAKVPVRR